MKKMFVLFVLAFMAFLTMPETAAAQYYPYPGYEQDVMTAYRVAPNTMMGGSGYYDPRSLMLINAISGNDCRYTTACGPVGRNNYPGQYNQYGYGGFYDPAYLKQMFSLPEALLACQLNFDTGRYEGCHTLLKTASYMEGHALRHEDRNEFLGTYHPYTKKDGSKVRHFRSFDDTNRRVSKGGKVIIGTAVGVIGGGILAGRKGAVAGGGAGALAGWLAAYRSNNHDNCEEIGQPASADQTSVEPSPTPTPTPIAGPVDPLASITWQTENTTNLRAVVTDQNTGEKKLIPGGGSLPLREPAGEQPYTVVLLDPGSGKSIPIPAVIRASKDLQGWEIVAREEN